MTENEIRQYNYTKGFNNYILKGNQKWIAFSKRVIEDKLKPAYGTQFNLIIYWYSVPESTAVDYIKVPYSAIAHLLTEEHLTGAGTNMERWNMIIKGGLLCAHANSKYSINIAPYLHTISEDRDCATVNDDYSAIEGDRQYKLHRNIERNKSLVKRLKENRQKIDKHLHCDICGFSFFDFYGDIGRSYIEAHHTVPLSEISGATRTRLRDFALVCANCHRMLHSKTPAYSIQQLKDMILH